MATWAGPPRAYTPGRVRPVQYVVIHSTEGSEGIKSAEAGVAYDKVRTDGTSTHLFVDTDTALMEVRYSDTAHAARAKGNACGIQVELCGVAGQTDAQWHDAASLPMLRLAAKEVAAICQEFALPPRRLSVAEVRAAYYAPAGQRPKGICGHIDVTKAYPEDQGSHTDPGPNFPWSEFLAMVTAEMDGDDVDYSRTTGWLLQNGVIQLEDPATIPQTDQAGSPPIGPGAPNLLAQKLNAIEAAVGKLALGGVDPDDLAAALSANAEFLAALAKAVNDDAARRLQS